MWPEVIGTRMTSQHASDSRRWARKRGDDSAKNPPPDFRLYEQSQPVFVETTVGLLFCYLLPYTFLMNLLYRYKALQFSGDLLLSWLMLLKIIWDRISRYFYTKEQQGSERPSDLAEITEGGREEGRTWTSLASSPLPSFSTMPHGSCSRTDGCRVTRMERGPHRVALASESQFLLQ